MESSSMVFGEKEWLSCCGSVRFAQEMVSAGPFSDYQEALDAARDIWFNKVDVNGWLQAFAAHSPTQWSKGEQSTALATATDSTFQEIYDWNALYKQKFGFVFVIFATGRSIVEILAEMMRRYHNRPMVELENAAREQMKITDLRVAKLFSVDATAASTTKNSTDVVTKAGGFVLDWLFPSLVCFICWSLLYLVCCHVFEFRDKLFDDEEMGFVFRSSF